MKNIPTFDEFLIESSSGFERDKQFWNSLSAAEQSLIMKDFGFSKISTKKSYDGLNSDFYNELRNYLVSINYDKKSLGKNSQRYL